MLPSLPPRSIMIYGDSGSTKTTQLYFIAKWYWEKMKLKTRLVTGDPGGLAPFIASGMVQNGIVQIMDYSNREHAVADIRKVAKGYWPRIGQDKNGNKGEYFKADEHCMTTPEQWAEIGPLMFDGYTSIAESLKRHCSDQPQGTIGFKEAFEYEEEGEFIRGLQQGHYGIVQKEIASLHSRWVKLPVKLVVATALLGKGVQRQSKETRLAPQIVGDAINADVPSWFWDCFHLESVNLQGQNGTLVPRKVAWFIDHPEQSSQILTLSKPRTLPENYPKLLEKFPYGFVELGFTSGLEQYLERMKEIGEIQ